MNKNDNPSLHGRAAFASIQYEEAKNLVSSLAPFSKLYRQTPYAESGSVKTYLNQVTYDGAKKLLTCMMDQGVSKITNIIFLNDFVMPDGFTEETLTFSEIEPYIALQAFVGNNKLINPDRTRDFRAYISAEPPYELTMIGYIPTDRANIAPTFNAACLIMGGDEQQSATSAGSAQKYAPTGSETLFSIVQFDPITKDPLTPFVIVWNVLFDVN